MATPHKRRIKKGASLVSLMLITFALPESVTTADGGTVSATPATPERTSAPVVKVPTDLPSTVSMGDAVSVTGTSGGDSRRMANDATVSSDAIPAAALAAYQRAETVIDGAAPACHLPWQLLAAIGRVESNHGRAQGNVLGNDGVDKPGIIGPRLNGKHHTRAIVDTDGGQYDGDTHFDHAVGPMQFIPSTWAVVGVDADGDGQRNPQDINDAALAAAVYLCAGGRDLSSQAGQDAAVASYNHSKAYIDTVLRVEQAYRSGGYTAVANQTVPASYLVPASSAPARHPAHHVAEHHAAGHHGAPVRTEQPTPTPSPSSPHTPSAAPSGKPAGKEKSDPAPLSSPHTSPGTGLAPVNGALSAATTAASCLTGSRGALVTSLLPGAGSLSPQTLLADLKNIPVLGAGLVKQLTGCVAGLGKGQGE